MLYARGVTINNQAIMQAIMQASNQAMDFYSDELSSRYIYFPSSVKNRGNRVGRNANGKRVLDPGPTSEERRHTRIVSRKVDTTEYSMDVLVGKMSRMTIEDKKAEDPEEVIVWKGKYIVCD